MKNLLRLIFLSLLIPAFESQAQTIYSQNFGTGTTLPSGWSTNSGASPAQVINENASSSTTYIIPSTPTGSAVVSGGSNLSMRDCAKNTTSPVTVTFNGISTIGSTGLILGLGTRETNGFGNAVSLTASTDGGTTFGQVVSTDIRTGAASTWQFNTFSLGVWAENVSNLIFRFSYIPDSNGGCASNSGNFRIDDFYLGANGVLPVKLSSFKAESLVNFVELNWETTEEINVNRFEIERSLDAQEFYKIETITAKNQASLYSFSDKTATQGVNYYRLKMIDNDDVFEYSKIVSANFGVDSQVFSLIENPVSTDEIKFLSQNYPIENLKLTSISGQDIPFQLRQEASIFLLKPTDKLNTGIYLLSIFDLKASKTLRVLIE